MPEEVVAIALAAIIGGTITITSVTRSVFALLRTRAERNAPAPSSLTTSELERIIRRAVGEATQPLLDKISYLEHRLEERAALPEKPRRSDLLSGMEAEPGAEQAPAARRRQPLR